MKIRKYRHRYNKLSTRLIASITIAVVICFGFFTYNVSTSIAEAEFQRFEQNTEILTKYISSEMSRLLEEIDDMSNYYELSLMTSKSVNDERENIKEGLLHYDQFASSVFLIKNPKTNHIVEYYKIGDSKHLTVMAPDFDVETLITTYNNSSPYNTQFIHFDSTSNKIFTIKKIYQIESNQEILIGIELNTEVLAKYLEDGNEELLGNMGITSEDGTIIAHTDKTLIGKSLKELSLGEDLESLLSDAIASNNHFKQTILRSLSDVEMIASEKHTFMFLPISLDEYNTSWGIIVDIQDSVLKESSLNIAKTIILGGFLTLLSLAFLIKLIVSKGLAPIDSIMGVMKDVASGNLNSRTSIASCNEMEVIGNQLNGLLDHMIEDRDSIVKQKNEIEDLLIEVENLMQENDRIYYETIKSLAKTIDAKDQYTGGHCDRVTEYALYIGSEMNLSSDELSSLTYGAMLHDIGKIGIAESIITKEGRLTDEEFFAIKTHPEKGFEILKDIHFLKDARLGVLQHHERFDGKGYPHGLAGEGIDLKARVIAIADAFDAMTSDRSYRDALSTERAIEQLIQNKGQQFDPQMVDIFVNGIQSSKLTV